MAMKRIPSIKQKTASLTQAIESKGYTPQNVGVDSLTQKNRENTELLHSLPKSPAYLESP